MKNDDQLYTDIMEKLEFEPIIDPSFLTLAIHDGIVTVKGTVRSYVEKRAVERAINCVSGVKAVADELEVSLLEKYKRHDEDIASAAVNALLWNMCVPSSKIKVVVDKGRITLTGEVEWWYQRESAEKAVRNLIGVTSVNNHITLRPSIKPNEVKEKILAEFKRNAEIDIKQINVSTSGSKVTLTGKTRSWPEIQEAVHAAWSVPGVTHVDNRLLIEQ